MADLKPMLATLLSSKGRKKLFFLYGTGKRTDGKGDGALAIATKKPKKADLEEACECKDVFEGSCWGSPDGVIYFQGKGKKLSAMLISKMMLAVKRETGRQYEFAAPAPEDEGPAEAAEAEEEQQEEETSETTVPEAPEAPPPPPAPAASASAVTRRLNGLTADIRAAIAQPGPNQARIQRLFQTVTASLQAGAADAAGTALDDLEALLAARGAPAASRTVTFDETAFRRVWPTIKQMWESASATVDAKLTELQAEMRADDDEEMKALANFGANAVTGNFKVPLRAVVLDIDKASGAALQKAVAKALPIVTAFKNHINTSEQVEVCDDNPWGVAVNIRTTLGTALAQMEKALAAVAK